MTVAEMLVLCERIERIPFICGEGLEPVLDLTNAVIELLSTPAPEGLADHARFVASEYPSEIARGHAVQILREADEAEGKK